MTIAIMDDVIELAQSIPVLEGRVYRAYPHVDANVYPYAVLNPMTRYTKETDDDGQERIIDVSFQIDMFGDSSASLDAVFDELNKLYNSKGLINSGYITSYSTSTEIYFATASWTATVDKRGMMYRG